MRATYPTSSKPAALLAAVALAIAACGGAASPQATPTPQSGGPASGTPESGAGTNPGATQAAAGVGGSGGSDCVQYNANQPNGSVQGSIVSTGVYPATWTFVVGNNGVNPNGTIGLTSDDNGPEADIQVHADGSIEFGGILPGPKGETLPNNVGQIFTGTGGQAMFCKTTNDVVIPYICGLSVDNDVTGTTDPTAKLHLKGTITIRGTIASTAGVTITCPS